MTAVKKRKQQGRVKNPPYDYYFLPGGTKFLSLSSFSHSFFPSSTKFIIFFKSVAVLGSIFFFNLSIWVSAGSPSFMNFTVPLSLNRYSGWFCTKLVHTSSPNL